MRPNIWKLQADKDIDGLIAALQYPDAEIRKRAAAALRTIGNTKAIFALERAMEHENDPLVREHVRSALAVFNHEEIIEELITTRNVSGLVEMLNSPRPQEILSAVNALGVIGDRTATEGLVMVFRNPLLPDDARLAAAEVLLKLENAPAVITLLGALRKDDWQVRRNAVTVLGQLKATWATKPIVNALRDAHSKVRRSAEIALTQIDTPEARTALKAYKQADALTKTAPLEDILHHEITMPPATASKPQQQAVVGNASEEEITLPVITPDMRRVLREAAGKQKAYETEAHPQDELSPALAAAEAALAQISPDGETLFDEEDENGEDKLK